MHSSQIRSSVRRRLGTKGRRYRRLKLLDIIDDVTGGKTENVLIRKERESRLRATKA